MADVVEADVEGLEVFCGHVLSTMTYRLEQFDLDLKGRVREFAQELRLRLDFRGHQVQDENAKRTDVLVDRAMLRHHEDVFALEYASGRKRVRDSDWHGQILP